MRELPWSVLFPLFVYRVVAPWFALGMLPGLVMRLYRRGNWRSKFGQRFGRFEAGDVERLRSRRWTWIQSISVGETHVALRLIKALQESDPGISVVLSVTTSTGYAMAEAAGSDRLFPMYNPVDAVGAVERVLEVMRPERLVLVEGGVWPNLVVACYRRRIPVVLANGRLSPRSARRYARARYLTGPFFELLEWVGVSDPEEVPRWEGVGVPRERIFVMGSIKFDQEGVGVGRREEFRELISSVGWGGGTRLLVAGSTHEGEEVLLGQLFLRWRGNHPRLRLVVAPRHVERVPSLRQALEAMGVRVILRSALPASGEAEVVLLDSTGELRDWYALATVAFVGKSLLAHGGQNPVEPALAGKPVVFGPHMENFEIIARHLCAAGGAFEVRDSEGLEEVVARLLGDPELCERSGARAAAALASHQGAASRTAALILRGGL